LFGFTLIKGVHFLQGSLVVRGSLLWEVHTYQGGSLFLVHFSLGFIILKGPHSVKGSLCQRVHFYLGFTFLKVHRLKGSPFLKGSLFGVHLLWFTF